MILPAALIRALGFCWCLTQHNESVVLNFNEENCLNANEPWMLWASRCEAKKVDDKGNWIALRRCLNWMLESTSKNDERRDGCGVRNLTTHSTRAEIGWFSSTTWILFDDSSRRVNSGVRRLKLNNVRQSCALVTLAAASRLLSCDHW